GEVEADHRPRGTGAADERVAVVAQGRDHAPLGPVRAQVAGQGAGVDLADAHDAVVVEVAVQLSRGPPGGRARGGFAHDEAGHLRPRRLHVLAVHAVVPDV